MKLVLVWIGKTGAEYMQRAVEEYVGRVRRYMPMEVVEVPDVRGVARGDVDGLRVAEGRALLRCVRGDDYVVLLDDKGREYTSVEWARELERLGVGSTRRLVCVIGGAYGFSREVYERANALLSLSRLTFSHQLVRVVFLEQVYRAMTILRGEPYHHEGSVFNVQ